ncbi:MAG: hypothetical protein R3B07_10080 [Polyangiaceae bacterium]
MKTTTLSLSILVLALLACKEEKKAEPAPTAATAAAPAPTPTETAAPAASEEEKKDESPIPDIPEGRSKPPTVAEWKAATNINTQEVNSQPDKCFMRIVREWLKVNCEGDVQGFTGMENFGNEMADYFQSVKPGKVADFVVRLRKGKTLKLRIQRGKEGEAVLFVNWPIGEEKPTIVALGRGAK